MDDVTRHEAIYGLCAVGATVAAASSPIRAAEPKRSTTMILCLIRYQIDPVQVDAFTEYAANWASSIPRCGGHLIGYFLPHEGTNDVAWGMIGFNSLAEYERYKERLRADAHSVANFQFAKSKRFILREERNFVRLVPGTFNLESAL